jgi:hypothetical protein
MVEEHEGEEEPTYDEYGDEPHDTDPVPDPASNDFYDPYRPGS